jgi:thymidylate synthase
VFWSGIVQELLWFLRGDTDAAVLSATGVRIWDANASAEALAAKHLPYPAGICGPIYGYQWRAWNHPYDPTCPRAPRGHRDQLAGLVHGLLHDPESRRHILTAWNPGQLDEMCLPPCHVLCQFYASSPDVTGTRHLSCQLYQRSGDVGLGVPFNIASYALLLSIIAHWCNMVPGEFIHVLGDAHIYETHVKPLRTQLARAPLPLPQLEVTAPRTGGRDLSTLSVDELGRELDLDIDAFDATSLRLSGYVHAPHISMEMAV